MELVFIVFTNLVSEPKYAVGGPRPNFQANDFLWPFLPSPFPCLLALLRFVYPCWVHFGQGYEVHLPFRTWRSKSLPQDLESHAEGGRGPMEVGCWACGHSFLLGPGGGVPQITDMSSFRAVVAVVQAAGGLFLIARHRHMGLERV